MTEADYSCGFYLYHDSSSEIGMRAFEAHHPQECLGRYDLAVTAYNDCPDKNVTKIVPLEVACTTPVARIKCHTSEVNYSYVDGEFPTVFLDPRDSYDPFFQAFPDGPANQAVFDTWAWYGTDSNVCGAMPTPCLISDIYHFGSNSFTDVENANWGVFQWSPASTVKSGFVTLKLKLSNGCKESWDSTTVRLGCDLGWQIRGQASPDNTAYTITHDYATNTNSYATSSIVDTAFNANRSTTIESHSSYEWTLLADSATLAATPPLFNASVSDYFHHPPPMEVPASFVSGIGSNGGVRATIDTPYPGQYTLKMRLDGGCNYSNDSVAVTISCSNLAFTAGPTSVTINYGEVAYFNSTVVSTPATGTAPDTYTRTWVRALYNSTGGLIEVPYADFVTAIAFQGSSYNNLVINTANVASENAAPLPNPFKAHVGVYVYDGQCNWVYQGADLTINCPTRGTVSSVQVKTTEVFSQSSPLLQSYNLTALYDRNPVTAYARWSWVCIAAPAGFLYTAGDIIPNQKTIFIYPTVPGFYSFQPRFHDGCGDVMTGTPQTFIVDACPANPLTVTATETSTTFDDQNSIGFTASWTFPAGYNLNSYVVDGWFVTSAPVNSSYAPFDYTVVSRSNMSYTNVTNSTAMTSNSLQQYITNSTKTTILRELYLRQRRFVMLDVFEDTMDTVIEYKSQYPTWLRPDIGGKYDVELRVSIDGTDGLCAYKASASVTVNCGAAPDLTAVPAEYKFTIRRDDVSPVLVLNATAASDTQPLAFAWVPVYPTDGNAPSPLFGEIQFPSPQSLTPLQTTNLYLFQPRTAGITYWFDLFVSDGCSVSHKRISVVTECSIEIPLTNTTLVATFDGTLPVMMMTVAYDYQHEVSQYLPFPSCQTYDWKFLGYSTEIPDGALVGGSTPFVKTAGFAGLIAAVVIVGVTVPVVLFLYFTKKACFKSTDSRV
jgi:hypothetical protein